MKGVTKAALYMRLSKDDEQFGDSISIETQLTKRVHETGRFYDADLEDLRRDYDGLWEAAQKILRSLAKIQ